LWSIRERGGIDFILDASLLAVSKSPVYPLIIDRTGEQLEARDVRFLNDRSAWNRPRTQFGKSIENIKQIHRSLFGIIPASTSIAERFECRRQCITPTLHDVIHGFAKR
jgi:hypothetical protein